MDARYKAITVKRESYQELKERTLKSHRSLDGEIVYLLELARDK